MTAKPVGAAGVPAAPPPSSDAHAANTTRPKNIARIMSASSRGGYRRSTVTLPVTVDPRSRNSHTSGVRVFAILLAVGCGDNSIDNTIAPTVLVDTNDEPNIVEVSLVASP